MNFEDVYHVITINSSQADEVNDLLAQGWKLLSINQRSEFDSPGYVKSDSFFVVGATKEVYEEHQKAIEETQEQTDYPF